MVILTFSLLNAHNDSGSAAPGLIGGPKDLTDGDADEPPIPHSPSSPRYLKPRARWFHRKLLNGTFGLVVIALLLFSSLAHTACASPTPIIGEQQPAIAPFPGFTRIKRQEAATCSCGPHENKDDATFAVEAAMIPLLVILSGAFAGLTLGYMSLDTTQLNVLAKSGTEKQRRLAAKIVPLRKDGHLLLITLLIANMICNEILPVVSDPVLGGGLQAVVVSTVLIVIFSEIIPQSVCSRFGLQIGAYAVWPVQMLVYVFYPVSWPIARLLTRILGAHSGVIYRRAELKELVNFHGESNEHGGDLNRDIVTIVGATLDLQEKRVMDAMTPMSKCFMLNVEDRLTFETLGKVMQSGHSRIPVYEDVKDTISGNENALPRRKILGVLLTKNLILIDPEDGVPLRDFPLHPVPLVPDVMPLLNILNSFQEGRSHLAIVCPRKAGYLPVGKTRTPARPGSPSSETAIDGDAPISGEDSGSETGGRNPLAKMFRRSRTHSISSKSLKSIKSHKGSKSHDKAEKGEIGENKVMLSVPLEEDMPMGFITLEDVIEEMLGEEILDEHDPDAFGNVASKPYLPPEAVEALTVSLRSKVSHASGSGTGKSSSAPTPPGTMAPKVTGSAKPSTGVLSRLNLGGMPRSLSAPGKSRSGAPQGSSGEASQVIEQTGLPITLLPPKRDHGPTNVQEQAFVVNNPVTESRVPTGSRKGADPSHGRLQVDAADQSRAPSVGVRHPVGGPATATGEMRPGPSRISGAILLQRGRRALANQGVDPDDVTLRLAQPASSFSSSGLSGSGASTPVLFLPSGQSTSSAGPKGVFKLPSRSISLPQRSGTPKQESPAGNAADRTTDPDLQVIPAEEPVEVDKGKTSKEGHTDG